MLYGSSIQNLSTHGDKWSFYGKLIEPSRIPLHRLCAVSLSASSSISHSHLYHLAVTENAMCLELAREEKNVSAVEIQHDVSPSELIAQGLQLEEAQYVSVSSHGLLS